jgi:hypothetical protein
MFGSAIVDIAIGIVFVFLLVSVIASTINEIILSFLNMRGKELLAGLETLLDDAGASGLVNRLYNHGQIYGLFKGLFDPNKPGNLPSYIPAQNFVMAFLDIVPAAAQLSTGGQLKATAAAAAAGANAPAAPPIQPQANVQGGAAPPDPSASAPAPQTSARITDTQPNAPLASSQAGNGAPSAQPPASAAGLSQDAALFASLWVAAKKLADDSKTEKVGKPLIAMLDAAGNNAVKLKKSLEDWYDSAMDRVSGWYKYRTQKILFAIGLVLAVAMNVDAINILKQLSKDAALRQSIVAAAGNAKQPGSSGTTETLKSQIHDAQTEVDGVNNLGIPVGWNHVPDILKTGTWHWHYLNILLGWLVTALAVSLGAPFWFDMLNKIMVVRSTVKPREKSQEEASKDTQKG